MAKEIDLSKKSSWDTLAVVGPILRQNALPLDSTEMFANLVDANAYANTPTAYIGQMIFVQSENAYYGIVKGDIEGTCELVKIGTGGSSQQIFYKTTEEWNEIPTFKGNAGSICIYSDYKTVTIGEETKNIAGIKIADGNAYIIDKPFVTTKIEMDLQNLSTTLSNHIDDTTIHTTADEKAFWNNKINTSDTIVGETLVINRN